MGKESTRVKICSLLNKPGKRQAEVVINYLGFTAPDKFLVGYGLDYKDHLRDVPFIGIPTEAAKEKYQ